MMQTVMMQMVIGSVFDETAEKRLTALLKRLDEID